VECFKRIILTFAVTLCLAGGPSSQAFAQAEDTEPNDTCAAAQDLGTLDGDGLFVTGSLDTPPDDPDVDFFRFAAAPGTTLLANLEGEDTDQGTLPDPLVGLFDSNCNLAGFNDDGGQGVNARLLFEVPDDGVVILAASAFDDFNFLGKGFVSGSYGLSIAPAPPPIGSIVGRVIDATTGEPLPAFVLLLRCDEFGECEEEVAEQNTDDEGRFRFERDFDGQPLPAGTYQVVAFADDFEDETTEPFDVGGGEDLDVGDIALSPAPFVFSNIVPCEDLLPQGDTCRYSVTLRNNTDAPFDGLAWSLVDGFDLPSSLGVTFFEASIVRGSRMAVRAPVSLRPFGEQTLYFRFDVPAFALGTEFCATVFLGVDPEPLVTTVGEDFLFCISGTEDGFEVQSAAETQKAASSLRGNSLSPSKRNGVLPSLRRATRP
jgi:hypothetical protein